MPIHDWTKVAPSTFHHFHNYWVDRTAEALNEGILPPPCYAMVEQPWEGREPDVLTLQAPGGDEIEPGAGMLRSAVTTPPKVRTIARSEESANLARQKSVVIRNDRDDRVIAIIEILSLGNKSSRARLQAFLDKAAGALAQGIHLLLIDLYPTTKRDPQGIHGVIWEQVGDGKYRAPRNKPLTLAAYTGGLPTTAYVQPIAVGDVLPDMPLFVDPDYYVPVPLEASYQAAWRALPRRWKAVLEGGQSA